MVFKEELYDHGCVPMYITEVEVLKYFAALAMLMMSTWSFSAIFKCDDGKNVIYTSTKKEGCSELENSIGVYSKDANGVKVVKSQLPSDVYPTKKVSSVDLEKEKQATSEIKVQMKSARGLSVKDIEAMRQQLRIHNGNMRNISHRLS
ncbi:hypothetical protein [Candidatus Ichthyocystis hellenicum]|uniref:hypothetical protein n=1 Tax=Candidatus Ichthyocystis hellenicum TaxID=1561003 RepID=UPI000B82D036|nr:hypothetical protein [Candidatus Ichthyocystis hellenicum]